MAQQGLPIKFQEVCATHSQPQRSLAATILFPCKALGASEGGVDARRFAPGSHASVADHRGTQLDAAWGAFAKL